MPTSDKSWWSLPRASGSKDAKSSSGFRSIAEAIGLKSRKHYSLSPAAPSPLQSTPDTRRFASPVPSLLTSKTRLKRSVGSMPVAMPDYVSRQASSSSTLLSANLTENPPCPKLRSRGMTDSALPQKAGFFVKDPLLHRKTSTNSKRPSPASTPSEAVPKLRIDRQTSARFHAPPTSPPTSCLPATPSPEPSSPSMAGYPTLNPVHDPKQISQSDLRAPEESIPESMEHPRRDSKTLPSPPRMLKKASSEHCLIRGASPAASVRTTTTGLDQQPCDKRTQRNHHSRLPLPIAIRTSFSTTTQQPSVKDPLPPSSMTETKKYRKRLFSNTSQRPSTSTSVPTNRMEDDSFSVFSSRSDYDPSLASHKPRTVTRPSSQDPSSFWDEGPDTTPHSPATSHADYYPQAIMSRDQLAKLEASLASLAESPKTRQCSPALPTRSDSITLSPTSALHSGRNSVRACPATLKSPSAGSLRHPVAADPLMKEPDGRATEQAPSADANPTRTPLESATGVVSLPPPPRPRLRSENSIFSMTSIATTSMSLGCPKANFRERPNTAITTTSPLQPGASGTGNLRVPLLYFSKSAGSQTQGSGAVLEKTIHPRSLMRKSSFLEIDVGDADPEPGVIEQRDSLFLSITSSDGSVDCNGSIVETGTGESFLDFARESFDTIRT